MTFRYCSFATTRGGSGAGLWQGWVLAFKQFFYASCRICHYGIWGFCCGPAAATIFCLPSAETSHVDLSSAVSQPGSVSGGKNWSRREAVEPQREACSPHPASCCAWNLSCRCHWLVGWDGGMLTGLIPAGEKTSVIRIKSCSCQLCNFFSAFLLRGSTCLMYMSRTPWRMKVLLSEAALHPGAWSGHQTEKGGG